MARHQDSSEAIRMPEGRICLSTAEYPPTLGGVAVAAARLADHLDTAGYEVHVITAVARPGTHGTMETTAERGIRVHRLLHEQPASSSGLFAYRRLLQSLDEQVGFDLFHGFFLTAAYPCLFAADQPGRERPFVASIRGNDVMTLLDQPLCRAMLLPVLRKATWITSVNAAYLERVAEEIDVIGRSSVIRNGVVAAQTRPWRLSAVNRGSVGTVGEFRKVKDIPLLVRVYAALPAALRTRLLLAGFFSDDEEESWTRTLIEEFGLHDEVELTGRFPHAQVATYLDRLHVYVQSSASEGLPNAVLEAAGAGVPLVATAVGGMREVLTDGVTALLVPHGDPRAMSAAIARVLSDDALAARLSDGANSLAADLTPSRERAEWLALYARLMP
jgi:glycosyltransferase involved in cell wall biosynthesis